MTKFFFLTFLGEPIIHGNDFFGFFPKEQEEEAVVNIDNNENYEKMNYGWHQPLYDDADESLELDSRYSYF